MSLTYTNIDYGEMNWNFYPGCLHWKDPKVCPVNLDCWAKNTTEGRMQQSFEPHLIPENLLDPLKRKKPTRILVNFRGDTFGDWVNPWQLIRRNIFSRWIFGDQLSIELANAVKEVINRCPQHQFFFLTKAPWNIKKWGQWPDNARLGGTVCSNGMMSIALTNLARVPAKHKWISFEPVIGQIGMSDHMSLKQAGIDWVVIGGWSRGKNPPKIEWVKEIVDACDKAGIPVFLKNNLIPIFVRTDKQSETETIQQTFKWALDKSGMGLRNELPARF